ncbi:uracil-xanthine permease family protein [uncultured Ruminococcus sp.]|uniref:uracil-xanthine permease family protein n=1 Tax=uncultured Ruminococcus sp. TaxID=165186 RepID=UPI0025E61A22|nr:solute carrier family 23 protein [uncultured Ruminococcus sp.]
MRIVYDVESKPKLGQMIVFALQQMLAILAATIAVPVIIGNGLTPAAAMFGAGVGTLVYVGFTKRKSPVLLGSSFAFIGSMSAAFAGAATVQLGMLGMIIGAAAAGLVYVLIAELIRIVGVEWLNKLMPPVVIGPTVAIIGLSLAGNAISDLQKSDVTDAAGSNYAAMVCGLITLAVTMLCSTYGKKMLRMVPFVMGILAGYAAAAVFTIIGGATGNDALKIVDFSVFSRVMFPDGKVTVSGFIKMPDLVFIEGFKGFGELTGGYLLTVLVAYVPVALVVFAEHVADHKNLSSVIGRDLLKEPGLVRTLLGDGVGSMAGAFFGGCPNTTYGESVGCVAITGNASVVTIITAAVGCILFSFVTPFVAFIDSIPSCVMGGVCISLYGFIAVSGLKMLKEVDLDNNRNLFTASVIFIAGIGGLSVSVGSVTLTEIAAALILGILTNKLLSKKSPEKDEH